MGSKVYAVRKGQVPGIYSTWKECQKQITGYNGAEFRSFKTKNEAENYIENGFLLVKSILKRPTNPIDALLYVDGAWNEKKRQYGYGFVIVKNGKQFSTGFGKGEKPNYLSQKQVSGEVVSVLQGLNRSIFKKLKHVEIIYDFDGIEKWITGEWNPKAAIAEAYVHELKRLNEKIEISFKKVKSRSGDEFNDIANRLAQRGANK